jgi:integrase
MAMILRWIDKQRAAEDRLAEATLRKNLGLLSRFFSWCVARGHATHNPVRNIPSTSRPQETPKKDAPWIDSDAVVRKIFNKLTNPVHLMFYLANRSGLRTGEVCGLRLSDLGFLAEGVIRARYSYNNPLKEDRTGTGKVKWVPAADDASAVLGPWVTRREAEGAGPEDLLFVAPKGGCFGRVYVRRAWREAAIAAKLTAPEMKDAKGQPLPLEPAMTWYEATRHSFVSRNLANGASLDEVSAAVGHSSPVVTRRFYDHFIRKNFSQGLRAGLALGGEAKGKRAGTVTPIRGKKKSASP